MNRPPVRYACAAALLATACAPAAAQTITTTGIAGVPVGGAFVLGALALLLAALAARALPRGARMALLLAAVALAGAQWGGQPLLAQVLARFTQPGGETLLIPVTPVANGFEPAYFENASGRGLHIAAIAPPGFTACFPGGVAPVLPPPASGGPADCAAGQPLAAGATCQVNVDAICKALAAQAVASISVAPATLNFTAGGSASVTVANAVSSPVAAQNVAAHIPGGSAITVQGTTCGGMLAIGASCTFTLTAMAPEGPTVVAFSGDNSNTVTASLTVVPLPAIAITGPVQQDRVIAVGGASLALAVTNNGTATATDITVVNKAAAPDVAVNDSNCTSVAPGASCTLLLTSSTPYAPATLTIGGSNTANSPSTLVAFSHLGGLVFEAGGGVGKVVSTTDPSPGSWIGSLADIPDAADVRDGVANTDVIVADAACTGNTARCAAQQCRNISPDWYLPAPNELVAALGALCSNSDTPCDFGNFQNSHYWTSQQLGIVEARAIQAPSAGLGDAAKIESRPYRCVRAFTN
ncbi:midcut-by-XrtH protein [Acidovorax sp. MR-S7]|uniref:midcut-by-XrtH protein n=1 Tax=Acidovorax sp. MR-S7 TaxID=1268622 RepID=UPI0003774E47|nr:midcut-by-XrtH protein [Acidovorax sp. MR-S7]GAD21023.1 hypothetical protein AVS7_00784 [Acidovorax sp. MR-S7]